MKRHFLIISVFIAFSFQSYSQSQFSGWLASFNSFKLNDKFSIHFDGQLRSADELSAVQTILLRPGLNYHFKNGMASGGYAFIANRRTVSNASSLLPEHRFWQQLILSHPVGKIATAHRFRFEERFIAQPQLTGTELEAGDFEQAFRFRYFIRNVLPLVEGAKFTKGPFLALQNEVFLNTGDKSFVNGKTFDQNRLYLAVGYRLPGKFDLEAGYMNQYSNTRTSFVNNHIAQLAVYKRL